MPTFSDASLMKLNTCVPELKELFTEVVEDFDCTVVCGHRNKADQNKAFDDGYSKVKWPDGKHNTVPSTAVDVVPYPIDWQDVDRMRYFAGYVMGLAKAKGISLRWGGDWDSDTEVMDNKFQDLVHFEIKD